MSTDSASRKIFPTSLNRFSWSEEKYALDLAIDKGEEGGSAGDEATSGSIAVDEAVQQAAP